MLWSTEDTTPSAKNLNRYVRKYSGDWYEIGIELGLEPRSLDIINKNFSQCNQCFQRTLDDWLNINDNATWKTLEVALTNVNRVKLGLDPVDDVLGKDVN